MRSDRRIEWLGYLLNAFDYQRTFYVIGAGASAGLIPMTSQLRQGIIGRYLGFGSFPAEIQQHDHVFDRIVGGLHEVTEPIKYEMLLRLNSSAVYAIAAQALTPAGLPSSIPQYELFQLVRKPATLFCLNVDGLLARFSDGHVLLEPHGRLPVKVMRSPEWDDLIDALLMYGLDCPRIPGLLLPQPEPRTITSGEAYRRAIELFAGAKFVVLIGYSFGLFGKSFDDFETLHFLCDLLKFYRNNVVIVDPWPNCIAGSIDEATNRRPAAVLRVCWNHMARALLEAKAKYQGTNFSELSAVARQILYRHDELLAITSASSGHG
jgi:hypothetical protein